MSDPNWLDKVITPKVGIVAIVESSDGEKILLIKRKFPPLGLAFPGGFVEVGETVAFAAMREVLEETGIAAEEVGLLGVTSGVDFDPRGQFVVLSAVFRDPHNKNPVAGDDALDAFWIEWRTLRINPKWDQMVERAKIEFEGYCNWRNYEEGSCEDFWSLQKMK